ncbi:MAG: hypothetical protein JXD19_07675 [Deltaproteobacteria bacterium]|nr:hypothetical protein [Deltaproteobacteria bacterium]
MNKEKLMKDIERTLFYNDIEVGKNELEKCQLGLTKLFIPEYDTGGVPAFKDLRQAYTHLTGDSDINGMFYPKKVSEGLRACMSFSSSSFAFALQNALNVSLAKIYKDFPYREEILISEKKPVTNFRKISSITLGYYEDLPDVDPETGDYQSLQRYEDAEVQYRLSQKGSAIFITRRAVINDAIDLINANVKRMARAARKTHARYVWEFYINNASCSDGTSWFNLEHGNLGTDALDFTPLVTAITALANMTEPGPSLEKIGLDLATFNWHLVVPLDLWDLGVKKNQQDCYYTSNDLTSKAPNACYRLFGDHNERIVSPPFLTDANNWGVIRDKEDVPIVEMSYLFGKEDPEFLLENGPTDEHVFKGDKLGYKIRHEYGGALVDYRGGYKSIVP